jgi:5-methylcytosine-specific restriction protein A
MPDAARRNPDWEWDETVLACDLVYQNGWQPLSPEDERVMELSRILRRMSLHPTALKFPELCPISGDSNL